MGRLGQEPTYDRGVRSASWVVAVLASSAGTAGCSSATQPLSEPSTPAAELVCATAIDAVDELPSDYLQLGGVVGLPDGSIQRNRGRADELGRRFSKMGLLVAPGEVFQLRVRSDTDDGVAIEWGAVEQPSATLTVELCVADETWLVFAGGVWTSHPGCVRLEVLGIGRPQGVDLPIGAPCP